MDEEAIYKKVGTRLVPFMMLLYLVAFLDRVNVGFAALTMNKDLGLSPYVFGWGAGIFFFGYFIFEVPSNVILEKVGARRWIARIMIPGASSRPPWRLPRGRSASTYCASCWASPRPASCRA
jgi:MFS transporter, ACS family, tartrate transporter